MVAVHAAVLVVAVSATVVLAARALLVGRMMAVAVDRRKPEDGCRHCGGKDDF
ncbi:MAG: hypothetical protein LBC63_10505 [Holophagales bacterium]|nr:hypothetical protein [Holophagales bacterium]